MALTEKNQLLIAFKKLYGKSHTSAKFGIFNESIATSVQLATSTLFGSTIPSIPSTGSYSITSGSVERVTFNLASISLSTYTNTLGSLAGTTIDDEGDTAVNGIHAYKLVLPNNYTSLSSNTKKGTGVFLNSATASDSNGGLQLIPPSLGDLYSAEVSSSSGIIGGLDAEDYYLDYYSGILFVQDIARTPTSVTAYLYVGDYGVVNSISSSFAINALTASYAANANINTASFATTGSNTFTGIQNFNNSITGTSAYFSGDLFVNGTASIARLNTISQSTLVIGDKYIVILSGGVDHTTLDGSGILYGSGSSGPTVDENGANAYIKFRSSIDKLEIFPGLRVSGSITSSEGISASSFVGDGSGLTNLPLSSYVTTSSFNSFTGSYNTGSFNGSFLGTASYALTAAYAENATNATSSVLQPTYHVTGNFTQDTVELQLPIGSGGFPVNDIDRIIYTLMTKETSGSNWRNDLASVELKVSSSHIYAVVSAPSQPYSYSFTALNQNITSSAAYSVTTASYALTAAYAENSSGNITVAYNNLREILTGSFGIDGTKTIELQKFADTDMDFVTFDILTKPSGTNYYTNDLISFQISGNLNNKISIYLSSPAYNSNDRYKIIAVKETGSF
jgi:hypothetical protein